MKILAIETSCDDTCIAILEAKGSKRPSFKILSNTISSQIKIHRKWGGVYPTLAKREHQQNLVPVLSQTLKGAKLLKKENKKQILKIKKLKEILKREPVLLKNLLIFFEKYKKPRIDVIAITVGHGLEPCLWVGVNFAKALSFWWNLPIIPVNHIEAHIYANLLPQICLKPKPKILSPKQIQFPALCLIVSGGCTQLILMQAHGKYKIIGETRDDAAGECFDKTARILGLPYPGGPAIAAEATKLQTVNYKLQTKLPRPMIYSKDYDFSFSGLKTAVLYDFKKSSPKIRKSKQYIREMAAEIQQAIVDVLIKKTIKAAKDSRVKTIILGGGVAANNELCKQLNYKLKTINYKLKFLVPPKIFCTDNAAMVGVVGYFYWLKSKVKTWQEIKAEANLKTA